MDCSARQVLNNLVFPPPGLDPAPPHPPTPGPRRALAAFPLGTAAAASAQQVSQAVAGLQAANQPSASCCQVTATFAAQRCPCDPVLAVILPSVGVEPVALQSAVKILAQTCTTFAAPTC